MTGQGDVYVEPNGRYIHIAQRDFRTNPDSIYYCKRELHPNGTISFTDGGNTPNVVYDENLAVWGEVSDNIDIVLDNESRAYIAFVTGGLTAHVIRSDYPIPLNGTWGYGDWTRTEAQTVFGNLWDQDFRYGINANSC
jgi:hypothetical protein